MTHSSDLSNRRRGVRAKRIITVRYRLAKRNRRRVESDWKISKSENMSVSGLLFVSGDQFLKDDILEIQVVMSGVIDIFIGFGRVVRVDNLPKGTHHVAVEYTELKPANRSAKKLTDNSNPS